MNKRKERKKTQIIDDPWNVFQVYVCMSLVCICVCIVVCVCVTLCVCVCVCVIVHNLSATSAPSAVWQASWEFVVRVMELRVFLVWAL